MRTEKKVKNISQDELGNKMGRVHVPAQEIKKIQTRKVKALKESKEEKKSRSRRRIKLSQLDEMLLRKCLGETMSKGLLFYMKFFR